MSFVKGGTNEGVYKLSEQLDTLLILPATLCWSVKSLTKDFCTDLLGVGINQKQKLDDQFSVILGKLSYLRTSGLNSCIGI